jgi:hypothetical protein
MRLLVLLSLPLLFGCPDPNASSSGTESTTGTTGNQGSVANGNQETDPSAARLTCTKEDADCLELSGKMVYAGEVKGSIRVDVQKVREGAAPSLVHTIELQPDGGFSFYAPKNYGKIIVTAFIDEDGDGPSQKDPQGRENIDIKDVALTDIKIEVKSDNAPVMPKPPEKPPQDDQKNTAEQKETPSDKKEDTPVKEEEKPKDNNSDGPPADE